MKTNKKIIILIILTVFIIFITPICSRANIDNNIQLSFTKDTIIIAGRPSSQVTITDGGYGGGSSGGGPYFGSGSGEDPLENPDKYNPGMLASSDITTVTNKVGPIFGIITTIGIVSGVLILIIIGIKYIVGSVEEKAEYKKTMIPYLVGAIMLIGIPSILTIFSRIIFSIVNRI